MEDLAKRVADWAASPEGKKSLEETAKRVRESNEEAERMGRIDPLLMIKPMTI